MCTIIELYLLYSLYCVIAMATTWSCPEMGDVPEQKWQVFMETMGLKHQDSRWILVWFTTDCIDRLLVAFGS